MLLPSLAGFAVAAACAAVAAKIADGGLRVVDAVTSDGKTKSLVAWLAALGVAGAPTLLVTASLPAPSDGRTPIRRQAAGATFHPTALVQ